MYVLIYCILIVMRLSKPKIHSICCMKYVYTRICDVIIVQHLGHYSVMHDKHQYLWLSFSYCYVYQLVIVCTIYFKIVSMCPHV